MILPAVVIHPQSLFSSTYLRNLTGFEFGEFLVDGSQNWYELLLLNQVPSLR